MLCPSTTIRSCHLETNGRYYSDKKANKRGHKTINDIKLCPLFEQKNSQQGLLLSNPLLVPPRKTQVKPYTAAGDKSKVEIPQYFPLKRP